MKQAVQIYGKLLGNAGIAISENLYSMVYIRGSGGAVQLIFNFFGCQMDSYAFVCILTLVVLLACALLMATVVPNVYEVKNRQTTMKLLLCAGCLTASVLSFSGVSEFLYFNF